MTPFNVVFPSPHTMGRPDGRILHEEVWPVCRSQERRYWGGGWIFLWSTSISLFLWPASSWPLCRSFLSCSKLLCNPSSLAAGLWGRGVTTETNTITSKLSFFVKLYTSNLVFARTIGMTTAYHSILLQGANLALLLTVLFLEVLNDPLHCVHHTL